MVHAGPEAAGKSPSTSNNSLIIGHFNEFNEWIVHYGTIQSKPHPTESHITQCVGGTFYTNRKIILLLVVFFYKDIIAGKVEANVVDLQKKIFFESYN
jgi:hypothetical protein